MGDLIVSGLLVLFSFGSYWIGYGIGRSDELIRIIHEDEARRGR